MGLLSDLQMGLGLKDRNKDYYKRTANTIRKQRGDMAADRYIERMQKAGMPKRGGLLSFNTNIGEYKNINDMFDRGGANASGGVFQGGGILSELANMLFSPTQQTSGFGTSAKILGERKDATGVSRPYDVNFEQRYRDALFTSEIPNMTTYDDYYDMMFP